jgi:hypothetical protein
MKFKRVGERRKLYKVLISRTEGNMPLLKTFCRWNDNIKMNCNPNACCSAEG